MTDVVALEMPGGTEWLDALRRCWDRGDAVAPMPEGQPAAARTALLGAIEPTHRIGPDGEKVAAVAGGRPAEDGDALIIATSGTTGRPRGVVLTHSALDAAADATFATVGCAPDDHWLACLPLHHVGGFSVVSRAIRRSLRITVLPRFDAADVMSAAAEGATLTSLVPTALARIDPTAFRLILLGGAAAPLRRPSNTVATYGMTETGGGVVYEGRPLAGVALRIGADGIISLRSPTMARCFRDGSPVTGDDGWFRTGDVGSIDTDTGLLDVVGRDDDVINTGGEKVWPVAVERVLLAHPAVHRVVVVGRSDPDWGSAVTAVVVPVDPTGPPDLDSLRALCREALPRAWAPRRVEIVEDLPTTSLGKVRRSEV